MRALSFYVLCAAQAVCQQADRDFILTTNSSLVLLEVSVRDRAGHHVSLNRENFQIRENGKPQTISQFAHDDAPVTIGLVIDDSGSMKRKRAEVIDSSIAFLDSS